MKLFLFFILFLTKISLATNWYIDAVNGSNSNDGLTEATALRDIYNTGGGDYTAIWDLVSAGDKVFIKNGTYTIPDLSATFIFNIDETTPIDNPVYWIGYGDNVIIQSAYGCYIPNRNQIFYNINFVSTRYGSNSFVFSSSTETAPKDTLKVKTKTSIINCYFKLDGVCGFGLASNVNVYDEEKSVEFFVYGNVFTHYNNSKRPSVSIGFSVSGVNTDNLENCKIVFQNNTLYFDSVKINSAYTAYCLSVTFSLARQVAFEIRNNIFVGGIRANGTRDAVLNLVSIVSGFYGTGYFLEEGNLFYPAATSTTGSWYPIRNATSGELPINESSSIVYPSFFNTTKFDLKKNSGAMYMGEIPGAILPNYINSK